MLHAYRKQQVFRNSMNCAVVHGYSGIATDQYISSLHQSIETSVGLNIRSETYRLDSLQMHSELVSQAE